MALAKGTNSYADVSEADVYFQDRLDVAAWSDATPTQKEQALITAATVLESIDWIGAVVSATQPLAFPRTGVYFDPRNGADVTLSGIPDRIMKASFELAHHLLNNDGLLDDTGSLKSISLGTIELTGVSTPALIPSNVTRLIKPLKVNGGSNLWFRAN